MIFLLVVVLIVFVTIVLGVLGLFFGGEDPYERYLAEMYRHEEMLEWRDRFNDKY